MFFLLLLFLLNYFSATFDQIHASNDFHTPPAAITVDPFQTVDPFASQSDIGSPTTTITNNDWFQSSNSGTTITNDPFLSKNDISSKNKKTAPKKISNIDPWGGSTATNNGNGWTPFSTSNGNSSSNSGAIQYRALYDYKPERSDEMAMSIGDIITVS